jgi:plasmid stabilization system protein ParE
MKIKFRTTTVADLKWFRRYYGKVFPEGAKNASTHFDRTYFNLLQHPQIGQKIEGSVHMREIFIPRTPFSFVYYVKGDVINVVRVLDLRAARPDDFQE